MIHPQDSHLSCVAFLSLVSGNAHLWTGAGDGEWLDIHAADLKPIKKSWLKQRSVLHEFQVESGGLSTAR